MVVLRSATKVCCTRLLADRDAVAASEVQLGFDALRLEATSLSSHFGKCQPLSLERTRLATAFNHVDTVPQGSGLHSLPCATTIAFGKTNSPTSVR